jgi:hypothetical protein
MRFRWLELFTGLQILSFEMWIVPSLPVALEEDKLIINLPYEIGAAKGLGIRSSVEQISPSTLNKIMKGVENGDKDNIYFYGLLKLYGISLSQDSAAAAASFLRAAQLGHKEATTAYGVSLSYGYGVKQDLVAAAKWFRTGISVGDLVRHSNFYLAGVSCVFFDKNILGRLLDAGKVKSMKLYYLLFPI